MTTIPDRLEVQSIRTTSTQRRRQEVGLAKMKELAKFRADQARLQAEHTRIQAKIQSEQAKQMKILARIQTDQAKVNNFRMN